MAYWTSFPRGVPRWWEVEAPAGEHHGEEEVFGAAGGWAQRPVSLGQAALGIWELRLARTEGPESLPPWIQLQHLEGCSLMTRSSWCPEKQAGVLVSTRGFPHERAFVLTRALAAG